MPLIPCPDCHTQVSAIAVTCPKCGRPIGAPMTVKPASPAGSTIALIASAVLLVATVVFVAASMSSRWEGFTILSAVCALATFATFIGGILTRETWK